MTKKLSIILIALLFGGENLMAAENNNQLQPNIYNIINSIKEWQVEINGQLIMADKIPMKHDERYHNMNTIYEQLLIEYHDTSTVYTELHRKFLQESQIRNTLVTTNDESRTEIMKLLNRMELLLGNDPLAQDVRGLAIERSGLYEEWNRKYVELNERERALRASDEKYNKLQMEYNELQKKYDEFKGRA